MQENVGNITFANDGKVEFENASVEINNVELFGDIDVADEDNDPLEISKEVSESSLPKNFQGRVYSEELVQVVSECRSPQDRQICSEINEVNAILPITFVLIPDMTNIQLVSLIHGESIAIPNKIFQMSTYCVKLVRFRPRAHNLNV